MKNMASNGTCSPGGTSKCGDGPKTSKFISTIPSFLEEDKDVQKMVQMIRHEEDRKMMLMREMKNKMGKVASQLTMENRSSGF